MHSLSLFYFGTSWVTFGPPLMPVFPHLPSNLMMSPWVLDLCLLVLSFPLEYWTMQIQSPAVALQTGHMAVPLWRFGSIVECQALFPSLFHFLQAELGMDKICFGLHPGNLLAWVSHYEVGSPVGWSHGLDTKADIIIIKMMLLYNICFQ